MNYTLLLSAIILLISHTSCENRSNPSVKEILPQFEVSDKHDTINYLDINGLKQGYWIHYEVGSSNVNPSIVFTADSNSHLKQFACPSGKCKLEEGYYKNDKKIGYWKRFNGDGTLKDSTKYNSTAN